MVSTQAARLSYALGNDKDYRSTGGCFAGYSFDLIANPADSFCEQHSRCRPRNLYRRQRARIECIAYSVDDGWKDQSVTPEMLEIRRQQQAAVIETLKKMAEQDMDQVAACLSR